MSSVFSPTTQAVRAALESDTQFGAVVPPLHLTSTFAFRGFGENAVRLHALRQSDAGRTR